MFTIIRRVRDLQSGKTCHTDFILQVHLQINTDSSLAKSKVSRRRAGGVRHLESRERYGTRSAHVTRDLGNSRTSSRCSRRRDISKSKAMHERVFRRSDLVSQTPKTVFSPASGAEVAARCGGTLGGRSVFVERRRVEGGGAWLSRDHGLALAWCGMVQRAIIACSGVA
jgi:hypothetical protein